MSVESDVVGAVTGAAGVAADANPITAILSNAKLIMIVLLIGAAVAAFFGIRWYISNEQAKIDALTKQVATQQIAITQDEQTIKQTQSDLAGLKVLTDGFNKQIANIQLNANKVSTTFNSQQYQALVKTQPAQAESQINTDVNQLFQDVNNASRESIPQ
jgi:hypothetical protein